MHNLKPKKHWGQHFLRDLNLAQKIATSLQCSSATPVVEIGPGEGVLTAFLAEKYANLSAVEVDPAAVKLLSQRFNADQLRIIHADVLRWQPDQSLAAPSAFIGNLPYNISSPFFFLLLEQRAWVKEGVFMVQDEVARRICSPPGKKSYGILSVLLGAYFELSYLFSVPPAAFRPPPKVMSGVLRLVPREEAPAVAFPQLKRVVKQAFGQRRKTLRNALKGLAFADFPEKANWFTLRAETLPWSAYVKLTAHLLPNEEA